MSQFYVQSGGNPPPPTPPVLFFTPDQGANVSPTVAGQVFATGEASGSTDINLRTFNGGANHLQFGLRWTGSVTTVGATTATVLSIPSTVGSITSLSGLVTGFEATAPNGIGGQVSGVVFNSGAGAVLIGNAVDSIYYSNVVVDPASFAVGVSGANLVVLVTGVAGLTISWTCTAIISTTSAI